jgi:hypothetical protein
VWANGVETWVECAASRDVGYAALVSYRKGA